MPSSKTARLAALHSAAIRAWKACGVRVSERPSRRSRSIRAASAVASAEAVPSAVGLITALATVLPTTVLATTVLAPAVLAAFAVLAVLAVLVAAALAVAALRDDIDVIPFLHDLVLAQLHLAVGDAFAGLHIVFHAMPGADEVHLGIGEVEPAGGLVRHDPLFDLGDG